MPRTFAAVDLIWPHTPDEDEVDIALAHLDGCDATAVERTPEGARVYFASDAARDRAMTLAASFAGVHATALAVPDEGWAERSQASISAVRIGRIVVTPPWLSPAAAADDIVIVIQPSMGFGTGHHASTRLCLALLQRVDVSGRSVLDVGTGSGVLAIAAHRLGAAKALAVDYDADALTSAEENLDLNQVRGAVTTRAVDIARTAATGGYDLLTANLTGGMLIRYASRLVDDVRPGGTMIVSGFQTAERDDVVAALVSAGATAGEAVIEDDWVAAVLTVRENPSRT